MLPDLSSIRKHRLALNLTQKQLADLCDVSQSVITKIERGRIDPSYTTAKRILERLDDLESKNLPELTAKDIMTSRVVSVKPSDSVEKAREIMLKNDFSQLPVMDQGIPVGGLTTKQLILGQELMGKKIEQVMSDTFPVVGCNATLSTLRELLSHNQAVLIRENRKIVGIVTDHDLLQAVGKSRGEK